MPGSTDWQEEILTRMEAIAGALYHTKEHGPGHGGQQVGGSGYVMGYKLIRQLVPGGQADAVAVVEDERQEKLYVAKKLCVNRNPMAVRAEVTTLRIIAHFQAQQNLNLMVDVAFRRGHNLGACVMILEYCDAGTLQDLIEHHNRNENPIHEGFLWHTLKSITNGLSFLHSGRLSTNSQLIDGWDPIYHLDIRPANIFLSTEGQRGPYSRIVIRDLGSVVSQKQINRGRINPHHPPEMCEAWEPPEGNGGRGLYGSFTDIWAAGGVIHCLSYFIDLGIPARHSMGTDQVINPSYNAWMGMLVARVKHHNFLERPNAWMIAECIEQSQPQI